MTKTNTLGEKVRELRKAKGWTQWHLAEVSGLSERTVRRIENGHTNPSLDTLQALAAVLGVECSELTRWAEEEPQPRTKTQIIAIDDGLHLFDTLAPSHAFAFDVDKTEDADDSGIQELITSILDAIETAEIWDVLEPAKRYTEGRRLSALLDDLRSWAWDVGVVRQIGTLQTENGPVPNWITSTLCFRKLATELTEPVTEVSSQVN